MEEKKVTSLKRELKLKEFQFNSIYEFSSSIYSSFRIDNIIRIFFSTLMGQMGVSRAFFFDSENKLFKRKGVKISDADINRFRKNVKKLSDDWFYLRIDDMEGELEDLKELLLSKKIHYLVNISNSKNKRIILGLGLRFNREELTVENIEFSFFVSR